MNFSSGRNNKWVVLAVMTSSLCMILVDQTIIGVALPRIQREFQATQTEIQWVVSGYILSFAVFLALGGKLGDIFGRTKTFAIGTLIFTIASALCGFSTSITFLITARMIQGLGGAIMQPASSVLVSMAFPIEERGKAMAIYAGIAMGFMAAGPLLGGFFTEYITWHWAFFINIPIGIYAFCSSIMIRPSESNSGHKLDIAGSVLLIIICFSIVYSIQEWNNTDIMITISLIAVGLIVSVVFYKIENKIQFPLIDFNVLKIKPFVVDMVVLFCYQYSMITNTIFGAIYLQNILKLSPLSAGFIMIAQLLFSIVSSQISGRILDRCGPRMPVLSGLLLAAIGFFGLFMVIQLRSLYCFILFNVILGIGSGFVITAANTDSLNRVPSELRGQSMGMMQTMRQIGSALGISISGSLIAGIEYMKVSSLIIKAGKDPGNIPVLCSLLSKTADIQETVLKKLTPMKWEVVVEKLRVVASESISIAYLVTAFMLVLGLVFAYKYMPKGRQQSDACSEIMAAVD